MLRTQILITSFIFTLLNLSAYAQRDVSEYNLTSNGAGLHHHITGSIYDPVAYFPEANGKAQRGQASYAVQYQQVEYLFSNQENAKLFLTNPQKYEPTYGGWCARAMVVGQKVGINPEIYIIHKNRIHFFVNQRAKRFFERNLKLNEQKADEHWKKISGENPRL